MRKILSIVAAAALLTSCGEKKEEKKDGFEVTRAKQQEATHLYHPILNYL